MPAGTPVFVASGNPHRCGSGPQLTDRATSGLAPCEPGFLLECELEGMEAIADLGGEVAGLAGVAWPGTSALAVLASRLPCVSENPATSTATTTSTALAAMDSSTRRDICRGRLRRLAIPYPLAQCRLQHECHPLLLLGGDLREQRQADDLSGRLLGHRKRAVGVTQSRER